MKMKFGNIEVVTHRDRLSLYERGELVGSIGNGTLTMGTVNHIADMAKALEWAAAFMSVNVPPGFKLVPESAVLLDECSVTVKNAPSSELLKKLNGLYIYPPYDGDTNARLMELAEVDASVCRAVLVYAETEEGSRAEALVKEELDEILKRKL